MCSRSSSFLVPGALLTAAPFLRKRAELLHPPILDKEQLSNFPLPSEVISQRQKSKKQEWKVQHFVMKFCVRGEKILSNPSLPSLSSQGKYQQVTLDKVSFTDSGGNDGLRSRGQWYGRVPSVHGPGQGLNSSAYSGLSVTFNLTG